MSNQPATPTAARPNDRLPDVMVNGKSETFFMSFATLNELAKVAGVVENAPLIMLDHELRERALEVVLKRKFKGDLKDQTFDLDNFELSADDAERLLIWISEHVLDFFMRSIRKIGDMGAENLKALQQLQNQLDPPSLPDGSTPSLSPKPAAGPLTKSPAS